MTECKQTNGLNEIHKMIAEELKAERATLKTALAGHLTISARTHKTSRKQLVDRYIDIRSAAGRPEGSTNRKETRTVQKQIRWTPEEWAEVERKASATKLTPSKWIRAQCL